MTVRHHTIFVFSGRPSYMKQFMDEGEMRTFIRKGYMVRDDNWAHVVFTYHDGVGCARAHTQFEILELWL